MQSIDPPKRFGRDISRTYRKWRRYIDMAFRDDDLSEATRSPLLAIYDHQTPMRQTDLARALGLDPSALVRVIALLQKRGLITCGPDPEDRRSKRISLTESGRGWVERIIARSLEVEARILASVSPAEIEMMRGVLARIAAAIPDS